MVGVREAKFKDMKLVSNIMVKSFRSAFASFVTRETLDVCTNESNCQAMMEGIYKEGKMHFIIGNDKGFLCWQDNDNTVEIVAIHSIPESWGTGLGSVMLKEALKRIGERPAFLWTFKDNVRARRFYEKHGFCWDRSERVSEFDEAVEVRYVRETI